MATREHPIYCPVPWCKAHKLRTVGCGDAQGPYEGLHVARLQYVKQWARLEQRRSKILGPLVAAQGRVIQDGIDMGLIPGWKKVCVIPWFDRPEEVFAACACLIHEDGKILVMRANDGRKGLPGGKREPGETALKAALRELDEEAGVGVEGTPDLVFESDATGRGVVPTFVWVNARVIGTPHGNGREGVPVWMKPGNLVSDTKYFAYNTQLLAELRRRGLIA